MLSPSHTLMISTPSPHHLTPSPSHTLMSSTPSPPPSHALTISCPDEQHAQPSPGAPPAAYLDPRPGIGGGQAAIVWRRCPLRMSAFSARFQVKIVLFSVTYRHKKVARSHDFELYERAFQQKNYKRSGEKE